MESSTRGAPGETGAGQQAAEGPNRLSMSNARGRRYYVYVLASKRMGALYVGMTDELLSCVIDHKSNIVDGLTRQYAIHQLVYFESFSHAGPALMREAELKNMPRCWKLNLITQHNFDWRDLYEDYAG